MKNKDNWSILVHFLNHLTAPPISPIFIHLSIRLHRVISRNEQSIKTCKNRALSEFFVLPLYHQLQLETIKIK